MPAFTETFTDDLSVTAGNATKASEYNNLANAADALKERLEVNTWFNNTGVTDQDGFLKGDWDDPFFIYQRDQGGWYCAMWIDNTVAADEKLRFKLGNSLANATPSSETDGSIILSGT